MSEKVSHSRYVVCIDTINDTRGDVGPKNPTSIERLHASIRRGCFEEAQGRTIKQDAKYCEAVTSRTTLAGKLGSKSTTLIEQQVQDLVLDICEHVKDADDQIFLFGSGEGAYIVRAIAGILHHMGIPKRDHLKDFERIYNYTLELIKARKVDYSRRGGTVLQYLRSVSHGTPNIEFVGLFDATKPYADKEIYDTSIVPTVKNFRHAMAFNERGVANFLDVPNCPEAKDLSGRSYIQAWFLGNHADIVGGVQHDGFSIYPLQWIMVEAMVVGLALSFDQAGVDSIQQENPIQLAFPQYAGHAPNISDSESVLWELRYANNIAIKMFDLQCIHVSSQEAEETSHSLRLEGVSRVYNAPRKIFSNGGKGLIGYVPGSPRGTIIHPSIFCILDRNPRFLEQNRFKVYKEHLADFETDCLCSDAATSPPWLQDSELLTSGVKAFRILVSGKTGVGKSTLINKVFGVEMTEESNSYAQGNHDINKAFESPNHPGLLIHDSRGWQAGSNQELELIARFLRHRAFQKEPSEALHVIWFCVDSDVSRIEEADKRTFETIAQYSNTVPVFVVGTKKDKMLGYHKMTILEDYMQKSNDYQESSRLAELEANKVADAQFATLLDELSDIKSYKADGHVCISRNDSSGISSLLTQTLDLIVDERVRLFCVAAQVVDVDKKIDSAITECMRLGTHAIRTAMVPLPFSGIVGTPTVSRIICEHVLQCFGFPKAVPDEVEEVMNRIVLGNLKKYLALSLAQFVVMASASSALALLTFGASAALWLATPFLNAPPSARMLLKCSAEMILILERSFRYNGKYVSVKQIEDAAKQYVSIDTETFSGETKNLQNHVRDLIDRLVPLKKITVGFRFKKLRTGLEHIVYKNRFDQPPEYEQHDPLAEKMTEIDASFTMVFEMPGDRQQSVESFGSTQKPIELDSTQTPIELDSTPRPLIAELPGSEPQSPRGRQLVAKLRAKWA